MRPQTISSSSAAARGRDFNLIGRLHSTSTEGRSRNFPLGAAAAAPSSGVGRNEKHAIAIEPLPPPQSSVMTLRRDGATLALDYIS